MNSEFKYLPIYLRNQNFIVLTLLSIVLIMSSFLFATLSKGHGMHIKIPITTISYLIIVIGFFVAKSAGEKILKINRQKFYLIAISIFIGFLFLVRSFSDQHADIWFTLYLCAVIYLVALTIGYEVSRK